MNDELGTFAEPSGESPPLDIGTLYKTISGIKVYKNEFLPDEVMLLVNSEYQILAVVKLGNSQIYKLWCKYEKIKNWFRKLFNNPDKKEMRWL